MLAIADAFGNVFAAIPGLASVANVTIEAAQKAVTNLLSPDEWSRTKDFEGRRIEEIDGGWHILNYGKYRKMMDEEERKEYKAKWAREKRRQSKTNVDRSRQSKTENGQCGHIPSASSSTSASDWIEELKKDAAYKDVDVQREYDKAIRWAKENKTGMTRRRFVNWLNRADRKLTGTEPRQAIWKDIT